LAPKNFHKVKNYLENNEKNSGAIPVELCEKSLTEQTLQYENFEIKNPI
jgi:hypothetical protein